jgi:hypothetical protein
MKVAMVVSKNKVMNQRGKKSRLIPTCCYPEFIKAKQNIIVHASDIAALT